jgi:hypothetical protein
MLAGWSWWQPDFLGRWGDLRKRQWKSGYFTLVAGPQVDPTLQGFGGPYSVGYVPVKPSWGGGQIQLEWMIWQGSKLVSFGAPEVFHGEAWCPQKSCMSPPNPGAGSDQDNGAQRTTGHPTCLCSFTDFFSLCIFDFLLGICLCSFMIWVFILAVVPWVFQSWDSICPQFWKVDADYISNIYSAVFILLSFLCQSHLYKLPHRPWSFSSLPLPASLPPCFLLPIFPFGEIFSLTHVPTYSLFSYIQSLNERLLRCSSFL